MPMMLIPTHCDACMRAALIEAELVDDGQALCETCGGTSRALPGETYGSQDQLLFKELATILREAGLTPLNAIQLAVSLDGRNSHPGIGLKCVAQLLPSRAVLELIAENEPAAMRKAEGILATLLEAIATGRSKSGVAPAAGIAEPSKQRSGS